MAPHYHIKLRGFHPLYSLGFFSLKFMTAEGADRWLSNLPWKDNKEYYVVGCTMTTPYECRHLQTSEEEGGE